MTWLCSRGPSQCSVGASFIITIASTNLAITYYNCHSWSALASSLSISRSTRPSFVPACMKSSCLLEGWQIGSHSCSPLGPSALAKAYNLIKFQPFAEVHRRNRLVDMTNYLLAQKARQCGHRGLQEIFDFMLLRYHQHMSSDFVRERWL